MKKIYFVLTYTGTILSRSVKLYTHKKYTHVSISLDENLDHMYSFGRLNAYNPFIGGFIQESPDYGTFKRFKKTKSIIYSLEISDKQYNNIKKEIDKFINTDEKYYFNMWGIIAVIFNKKPTRKNHFYCAEFVKYVLDNAGVDLNLPEIVKPDDFTHIDDLSVIYEGLLRDYK